jgi:hypothetical protein
MAALFYRKQPLLAAGCLEATVILPPFYVPDAAVPMSAHNLLSKRHDQKCSNHLVEHT